MLTDFSVCNACNGAYGLLFWFVFQLQRADEPLETETRDTRTSSVSVNVSSLCLTFSLHLSLYVVLTPLKETDDASLVNTHILW